MSDVIYEYTGYPITITITRVDDGYQVEASWKSGRIMCLRLTEKDVEQMASAISHLAIDWLDAQISRMIADARGDE